MSRGQGGFTLLEVLVALTLFGLLATMMLGGLRLGARAWERVSDHTGQAAAIEAVQGFLRRSLTETLPPAPPGTLHPVDFDGGPSALTFTTPPRGPNADLQVVTLRRDGGRLVAVWRSAGPPRERVLLERVAALRLAYYGSLAPGQIPAWREDWRGAAALPRLVRVSVAFPPGDPRFWPELVAAPMLDGGGLCAVLASGCARP